MTDRTLLLLRHGKSAWDDPSLNDFDRPLAPRGRRAAALMAAHMLDAGLVPDLALCSPALRARQTFETLARQWSAPPARPEPDLYFAGPQAILVRLRTLDTAVRTVMVVGHNPDLEDLAVMLASGGDTDALNRMRRKFPTAALAVIRFEAETWGEVRPGSGRLTEFVTPKELA